MNLKILFLSIFLFTVPKCLAASPDVNNKTTEEKTEVKRDWPKLIKGYSAYAAAVICGVVSLYTYYRSICLLPGVFTKTNYRDDIGNTEQWRSLPGMVGSFFGGPVIASLTATGALYCGRKIYLYAEKKLEENPHVS